MPDRFRPRGAIDAVLLLARIVVGGVLIAHGWQKLQQGVPGVAAGFGQMGIPAPDAAAWFAILVELVGGAALVLGALAPAAGVLVAVNMAGAWWFVHRGAGVFVADGGWELVAVIGAAALVLGLVPGRLSVDRWLFAPALREAEAGVRT